MNLSWIIAHSTNIIDGGEYKGNRLDDVAEINGATVDVFMGHPNHPTSASSDVWALTFGPWPNPK